MTFIQPNKNTNILNLIIAGLTVGIISISFVLIVLYNKQVGMDHGIAAMTAEMQKVQAVNAELKEKTVAILGGENSEVFAAERGLTQDRNPGYLEIGTAPKWDIASR